MLQASLVNLRQHAYEQILGMLMNGELPPGTKVSTPALAKQLNISRTPIREALTRLTHQGLLKETPGFGMYVQMPERAELEELYAMREVLECFAASEAARHIRRAELARLKELCRQWRGLVRELTTHPERRLDPGLHDRWIKLDEAFHGVLLEAAQNQLLSKTVGEMRLLSRTLDLRRFESIAFITPRLAAQTYRQHSTLVRALERGDADAAALWMRKQIRDGRQLHLEHFEAVQQRLKSGR